MLAAMSWDGVTLDADLAVGLAGIERDDGLATAVVLSLFTDARARPDDPLPDDGGRRGWLGDALADARGDRIGSRLWLLARAKQTEETRRRAEDYAREALAWLAEDGVATGVAVSAAWVATGTLSLSVTITLPDGRQEWLGYQVRAGGGA